MDGTSGAKAVWVGRGVVVTGASGFLGAWLTQALLAAGARVIALVRDEPRPSGLDLFALRERVTRVPGSVEDATAVERAIVEYDASVVCHLAAQTLVGPARQSPVATFETNIRGAWTVLEACRRQAARIGALLVASSDKAYGDQAQLPYREDFCLRPRFPYDASKACADILARSYFHTYGLPVAVTRCANLYGGGDMNFSRVVPGTIRAALAGQRPEIRSDGTPVRDYLYAEDAVQGYMALAEAVLAGRCHGEPLNFGTAEPIAVLPLVRAVLHACGRPDLEPDVRATAQGEIDRQFLDSRRAMELLGWRAQTPLSQGLAATVAWYRGHLQPVA
ncbi:MAG: NAD-dependent epimerase/dehydratase family protein [Terriglobales bacterium]